MVLDLIQKQYLYDTLFSPDDALKRACISGDLKKIEKIWTITNTLGGQLNLEVNDSILENLCLIGELECIEFLFKKLYSDNKEDYIKKTLLDCFYSACLSGKIEAVNYVYELCKKYEVYPCMSKLENNDIVKQLIINNFRDVLEFILSLDKLRDLGLGLKDVNEYTIFSTKIITNRISYLFMVSCVHNNPDITILLLNLGFDIDVYKGFLKDLILKENIECAEIFLEIDKSFKRDIDFCQLSDIVIGSDNYSTLNWMLNKNLIPSLDKNTGTEMLNLAISCQSKKIIDFLVNYLGKDLDGNELLKGYALLLITPNIKSNTQNICEYLIELLNDLKIDNIYKTTIDAFHYCVKSLNVQGVNNILMINSPDITDIKIGLMNLGEIKNKDVYKIVQIFDLLYPKVKSFLESSEHQHLINIFSTNSGSTKIINSLMNIKTPTVFTPLSRSNTPSPTYSLNNEDYYDYYDNNDYSGYHDIENLPSYIN